MKSKLLKALPVFATLAMTPGTSLAGDGIIEINQARALAGSVTPGDSAGFPVTLSVRGSYILTGNLDAGAAVGIEITAADVAVDLNGFKLAGTLVGSSVGISSSFVGTRIRDGVVQLFGGAGMDLESAAFVDNVRVTNCNGNGIDVGHDSQVRNSQVVANGFRGIWAGNNSVVTGNVARGNFIGIRADGGVIRDNAVEGDGNIGIQAEGRATVVINNTVNGMHDVGLAMSSGVGYAGNALAGATKNANGGVQIGPNVCGTSLCP